MMIRGRVEWGFAFLSPRLRAMGAPTSIILGIIPGWFGWVGAIVRCFDAECARRSGRIAGLPLSRGLSIDPLPHALAHAALLLWNCS